MKSLIPLLILLALSSCVTQKKCNSKFPPEVIRERYDSLVIKDSVIYKDRIVPFYIKGETITKDSIIPGLPEKINTVPIKLENDYAIASAWIENSKLKLKLDLKDQVMKFKLDSADKISKHWEFQYRKLRDIITPPPIKETPKFWLITGWAFIILVVAAIGYLVLKILNKLP